MQKQNYFHHNLPYFSLPHYLMASLIVNESISNIISHLSYFHFNHLTTTHSTSAVQSTAESFLSLHFNDLSRHHSNNVFPNTTGFIFSLRLNELRAITQ